MKKKIISILILIITITLFIFFIFKINTKEDIIHGGDSITVEGIDKIISIDVLDSYELQTDPFYNRYYKDILISETFFTNENSSDCGVFTIEILSYKNIARTTIFINGESEYIYTNIEINNYIKALHKKKKLTIDDKKFTIGFLPDDDVDDNIAKAYVKDGDYFLSFTIHGCDDVLSKELYGDFINMLKTIKFLN